MPKKIAGHVMLDLETLATTADAVILSIGAVRFDLDSDYIDDAGFYSSVSIDSNLEYGRRIDESTLVWWLKQEAAAQAVFHEPKVHLSAALNALTDWMYPSDRLEVWSNGADFDIPMLAHAFRQAGADVPWNFWNTNCLRTYKKLPAAKAVPRPEAAVKHNALHDAIAQAKLAQAIRRAMKVAA